MPLTAEAYQSLIPIEVGDVDGFIAAQIDTLWVLFDTEPVLYVRYLVTKRKALDLLMGKVRDEVNQAGNNASIELSDKLDHLQVMWRNVDGEIGQARIDAETLAQRVAGSSRRPLAGRLTGVLIGPSGVIR